MLNEEFNNFFEAHLNNLGYLVDGNRYNLSFTLEHRENSESCIQSISTTRIKCDSKLNEKDILPKLKSLALQ